MKKIQKFKSGGAPSSAKNIKFGIIFTTYTKKIRSIGRERKEIFFPILRKVSEWPKCVAEIIAFKDAG